MKLLEVIDKFIAEPQPTTIARVMVDQPDDESRAKLEEKIEAAKKFLGSKYLCHPSKRVERKAA